MCCVSPLDEIDYAACAGVRFVLADIDDTITTDGALTARAYTAMERLHDAGLVVVPITGRPAGWCDHIARMWPVGGVVGENGAFWFRYDRGARRLIKRFVASDAERELNRERLHALAEQILSAVPGTSLASDQLYREADIAIDYREDVEPLPAAAVDRIVAIAQAAGATAKVSSIHVNVWFGDYDKLGMTRTLFAECFDTDLDAARAQFAFVGDSPNDTPMFEFFPLAVGVANVNDFEDRIAHKPAFVTQARGGAGFAEFAVRLLDARASDAATPVDVSR
jgi:HAD superfamily hydrolase (TIGR01484 family)